MNEYSVTVRSKNIQYLAYLLILFDLLEHGEGAEVSDRDVEAAVRLLCLKFTDYLDAYADDLPSTWHRGDPRFGPDILAVLETLLKKLKHAYGKQGDQ